MSSVRRDPVSWPRPSGARTFWVGRLRTGGYASLHHRLILDCPPGNVRFAGRAPGRPQTGSGSASRVRRSGRTRRRHVSVSAFQCFSRSSALRASSISLMRNESSLAPGRPLYRNALEAARPRAAGYVWGSPGSVEASRLRDTIVTGFHATNLRCLRSVGETYRRLCLLILLDCIRDRDIPPANSEQVDVKRCPGSRASLPAAQYLLQGRQEPARNHSCHFPS